MDLKYNICLNFVTQVLGDWAINVYTNTKIYKYIITFIYFNIYIILTFILRFFKIVVKFLDALIKE